MYHFNAWFQPHQTKDAPCSRDPFPKPLIKMSRLADLNEVSGEEMITFVCFKTLFCSAVKVVSWFHNWLNDDYLSLFLRRAKIFFCSFLLPFLYTCCDVCCICQHSKVVIPSWKVQFVCDHYYKLLNIIISFKRFSYCLRLHRSNCFEHEYHTKKSKEITAVHISFNLFNKCTVCGDAKVTKQNKKFLTNDFKGIGTVLCGKLMSYSKPFNCLLHH